ncbi:sulfite exporter TauE/SafE family protein [Proteiniborus sp. MB09-C3]|uniref:sulfite exporter TauE/SafE family protein n=1 Tax=Proteiniborus sp. MB09-C3 TaxID=3050072 RepID=UPI0025563340|nr:sulfite exporter TauE/SafE family protein [Proteiniborus sp. MB09-C3]WIV10735.1 sulfite exporter TauE/SafE family protein [Proteiniborus sp. MB09-C3]
MDNKKSKIKLLLIGLIIGLVNGLFGSGGGTIAVPALVLMLGLDQHKAHATAISIIFPLSLISSFLYFRHGVLNLKIAAIVTLGGIIGSYIGARNLTKVPSNILRKVFGIFMIIAAIRMVMI